MAAYADSYDQVRTNYRNLLYYKVCEDPFIKINATNNNVAEWVSIDDEGHIEFVIRFIKGCTCTDNDCIEKGKYTPTYYQLKVEQWYMRSDAELEKTQKEFLFCALLGDDIEDRYGFEHKPSKYCVKGVLEKIKYHTYEEENDHIHWEFLQDNYEIGVSKEFFDLLITEHRKYLGTDNNDWSN